MILAQQKELSSKGHNGSFLTEDCVQMSAVSGFDVVADRIYWFKVLRLLDM